MENPQAFPYFVTHPDGHIAGKEGMSLRDYFAGQALIGCMNNITNITNVEGDITNMLTESSYRVAS